MPTFYEIFGIKADKVLETDMSKIRASICPFTGSCCDGGGNRHQTKIVFSPEHQLRRFFDDSISSVVPAVCSIDYGNNQWVVCPRRLMGFKNDTKEIPELNRSLQEHERQALSMIGLKADIIYGVWSEVYLQYNIDDTEIDYHFDFIIAPLKKDVPLKDLEVEYQCSPSEIAQLAKCARDGKNLVGKSTTGTVIAVPDLSHPFIVEIMTASTSGSNTLAGTNISSAFLNLLQGNKYQSPGINKRQVWGRMATQLFAKSALAECWGGKTFWVVQDELLKNIELTTRLKIATTTQNSETINFLLMKYQPKDQGHEAHIVVDKLAILNSGLSFKGSDSCSDILLPKVFPPKLWLLKSMLRRSLAATIKL